MIEKMSKIVSGKYLLKISILLFSVFGLILIDVFIFTVLLNEASAATWWNSSWLYRKKLVFNNSAQNENLADFPVMVKLTSLNFDFSKTKTNGEDIRFVDSDDSAELNYEIEKWDSSAQEAFIWVKVPQIDASSSTDFVYMYYGNSGAADAQNVAGTWNSGFAGVWHLDEIVYNNDINYDSTANGNNGAWKDSNNSVGNATGIIDGANDFDTSDRIDITDNASLQSSIFTIEGWGRLNGSGWNTLASKGDWNVNKMWFGNSDNNKLLLKLNRVAYSPYVSNTLLNDGKWHYLVGTYDGSYIRVYVDGNLDNTPYSSTGMSSTAGIFQISGNDGWGGVALWNGDIDEVRYSNVARSANWISAQHKSMNNTFITFNAPEDSPPAAPLNASAVRNSDTQITVSWTDNSSNETGFKVERNTDSGSGFGGWSQILTVSANTASAVDDSVNNPSDPPQENKRYQYRIRAYNATDNSDYSTSSVVYTSPSAPEIGVPTADSSSAITWTWTDNSNFEDSFNLDFVIGNGTDVSGIAADTTSYQSADLDSNTQYAAHVHSYRADTGESFSSSDSLAVYTLAPAPTDFTGAAADRAIILSVASFNNADSDSSGYRFTNTTTNTSSGWIQDNSWTNSELACGTSYNYTVKYKNGDGAETDVESLTQSTNSCGGGGKSSIQSNPPQPPIGGFRVLINDGADYTKSSKVILNLFGGPDTEKMAISNFFDFRDALQRIYKSIKEWDLCKGISFCSEGKYTVYVKFFTSWGESSKIISDSIIFSIPPVNENIIPFKPELKTTTPIFIPETLIPLPTPLIEIKLDRPIFTLARSNIAVGSIAFQKPLKLVAGQTLETSIKPSKPVKTIKVVIIFKKSKESSNLKGSLLSALFTPVYAQIWQTAEYVLTDEDKNGVYEGEIKLPEVSGEYTIKTILYYEDGTIEEVETETLIDPRGYIYQEIDGKELRIPNAEVSLYVFNPGTNQFELWRAQDYGQKNPQITGKTGEYEFLVPEGKYYLTVTSPDYREYQSEKFEVEKGSVVNENIKLAPIKKINWFWSTLSIVFFVLIIGLLIRVFTVKKGRG